MQKYAVYWPEGGAASQYTAKNPFLDLSKMTQKLSHHTHVLSKLKLLLK
jgi:hypothetical protein